MSTTTNDSSYGPGNDQPVDSRQATTITVPSGQQVCFQFSPASSPYNAIVIYPSSNASGNDLDKSQSHTASTALEAGPQSTMDPWTYPPAGTRGDTHVFVTSWALTKDEAWVQIPSTQSGGRISFTYQVEKISSGS